MKQWVCETVPGLFPKRDKGVSHGCFISKHCFKMKQSRETPSSHLGNSHFWCRYCFTSFTVSNKTMSLFQLKQGNRFLRGTEDVSPTVCFAMINFKCVLTSSYINPIILLQIDAMKT